MSNEPIDAVFEETNETIPVAEPIVMTAPEPPAAALPAGPLPPCEPCSKVAGREVPEHPGYCHCGAPLVNGRCGKPLPVPPPVEVSIDEAAVALLEVGETAMAVRGEDGLA